MVMAWVVRRRILYLLAFAAVLSAYLSFVHLVHLAVISASRAASQAANRMPPQAPTPSRRLPTVTGYSLEMQFRTTPRYSCPDLQRPDSQDIQLHNHYWQHPNDSTLYLYSAHLDSRMQAGGATYPFVRILGMSEGSLESNGTTFCQIWMSGQSQPIISPVTSSEIWIDTWDQNAGARTYRPYLLSCAVLDTNVGARGPKENKPFAVSIVKNPCDAATSFLRLKVTPVVPESKKKDFALCIKGMDFSLDLSVNLVEWIELNRILGAQIFTFYVYQIHPNMNRVLKWYAKAGVAQVIHLTLPGMQPNFSRERTKYLRRNVWQKRRNELVPYNDCFYRHAFKYKYVVPIDIDEVIVPKQHDNWTLLINHIAREDPDLMKQHASLSAQQVYFFSKNQPAPKDLSQIPPYLPMLRQTRRAADFTRAGHGVKSFMLSNQCLTVFNHYAIEALHPGVTRNVILPTREVQLNHYRKDCPLQAREECNKYTSRTNIDRRLWIYKDRLLPRVERVLQELFSPA